MLSTVPGSHDGANNALSACKKGTTLRDNNELSMRTSSLPSAVVSGDKSSVYHNRFLGLGYKWHYKASDYLYMLN